MIQSTSFAEDVQKAFRPTPRGVVGLVDDLLDLCRHHQLYLRFAEEHCKVRRLGAADCDSLTVHIPKSVFRATLARVAALCNEQTPNSVTPYRGEGEVIVPTPSLPNGAPPSTCYVSFVNTPSEQHLEMRFSQSTADHGNYFAVLLRDQRTVTVYGHALKYIPHASDQTDVGSYGILARSSDGEILVALFRVSEVIGVYCCDARAPGGNTTSTAGPGSAAASSRGEVPAATSLR